MGGSGTTDVIARDQITAQRPGVATHTRKILVRPTDLSLPIFWCPCPRIADAL
jgi:hypothetical protein